MPDFTLKMHQIQFSAPDSTGEAHGAPRPLVGFGEKGKERKKGRERGGEGARGKRRGREGGTGRGRAKEEGEMVEGGEEGRGNY